MNNIFLIGSAGFTKEIEDNLMGKGVSTLRFRSVNSIKYRQEDTPDLIIIERSQSKEASFREFLNSYRETPKIVITDSPVLAGISPWMKTELMHPLSSREPKELELAMRRILHEKHLVSENRVLTTRLAGMKKELDFLEEVSKTLTSSLELNAVLSTIMKKTKNLLEAAGLLRDKVPEVQFAFIGAGIEVDRLMRSAKEKGLDNVRFLPPRPFSGIGEVLNLADVLLVHLKDDPLFHVTIPSKTQAYLAVGRPILMAVREDAADLVERAGAGIACAPENPQAIAEGVLNLYHKPRQELEQMGENGRRYYRGELSLAVGVAKFDEVFGSVAAGGIH